MKSTQDDLEHFKSVIVYEALVEPADKNYFNARWSFFYKQYEEFFWQAAQALEKYMKAALALNGTSKYKEDHDLSEAIPKLPIELTHADAEFAKKIFVLGCTNVRYGMTNWVVENDDLFKLDRVLFQVRRQTVNFDIIPKIPTQSVKIPVNVGDKYREILLNDKTYQPRGPIDIKHLNQNISLSAEEILKCNSNFVPEYAEKGGAVFLESLPNSKNSRIGLQYEEWSNAVKLSEVDIIKIKWLLEHIKWKKDDLSDLKMLLRQK